MATGSVLPAPAPAGSIPTDAQCDLATLLRFLLDRAGLTPRQLAAEQDIPYSPAMLYQFFSGLALPPPQLIDAVARRCGGETVELQNAYDRARRAALAAFRHGPPSSGRRREGDSAASGSRQPAREESRPRTREQPGQEAPAGRRRGPRAPRHSRSHQPVPTERRRTKNRLVTSLTTSVGRTEDDNTRDIRTRLLAAGLGACVASVVIVSATDGFGLQSSSGADARPKPPSSAPAPPVIPPSAAPSPGDDDTLPAPPRRKRAERRNQRARKPPPPAPRAAPRVQLVRNGTFTGGFAPWQVEGDLQAGVANNQMRAQVFADDDQEPFDAVVDSGSFALRDDRSYVLSFDASASANVAIFATVLRFEDQPALIQQTNLNGQLRRFTFRFTSRIASQDSIVGFELGGQEDDIVVVIDNVTLTEVR